MTKRLVEIDDELLDTARAILRAQTIRETVEQALRHVVEADAGRIDRIVTAFSATDFGERSESWR